MLILIRAITLTQGAIECFDDVGLAFALGVGSMRAGWKRLGVGRKQVRKIPAMPAVALGLGCPEAVGRGRIAPAQYPRHDASAGGFDGQPESDLVPSAAYKRPHFTQFKGFSILLLRFFRPQARQCQAG